MGHLLSSVDDIFGQSEAVDAGPSGDRVVTRRGVSHLHGIELQEGLSQSHSTEQQVPAGGNRAVCISVCCVQLPSEVGSDHLQMLLNSYCNTCTCTCTFCLFSNYRLDQYHLFLLESHFFFCISIRTVTRAQFLNTLPTSGFHTGGSKQQQAAAVTSEPRTDTLITMHAPISGLVINEILRVPYSYLENMCQYHDTN